MITLTPAYGRDYTSKAKAVADFEANRDFILNSFGDRWDGKPINKTQCQGSGFNRVQIRYKKLRSVCVVEVTI